MDKSDALSQIDDLFRRIVPGLLATVNASGHTWETVRYTVTWDPDGISEANLASIDPGQTRYHFAPLDINNDLRLLWHTNLTLLRPWTGWVLKIDREGECIIDFTYDPPRG